MGGGGSEAQEIGEGKNFTHLAATTMDCRWPRRVRQCGTPHSSSLSSICGRRVQVPAEQRARHAAHLCTREQYRQALGVRGSWLPGNRSCTQAQEHCSLPLPGKARPHPGTPEDAVWANSGRGSSRVLRGAHTGVRGPGTHRHAVERELAMDFELVRRRQPPAGVQQHVVELQGRTEAVGPMGPSPRPPAWGPALPAALTRKNMRCWSPFPESLLRLPRRMNSCGQTERAHGDAACCLALPGLQVPKSRLGAGAAGSQQLVCALIPASGLT